MVMKKFLNVCHIDAKTLPEAWFLSLGLCLTTGYEYKIDKGSFAGRRRKEFDFVTINIEYPGSRPLVPDTPEGVDPPTSQEFVEGYLPYLMTGVKQDNEQYTYGEDLERQIPEVIRIYRESGPNNNQLYMAVGDRNSIILNDPPCLRGIDTRIRYGALHFIVYFRSWDLWGGFPVNLASIQILKEYMAGEIGVEDGQLIALSKGLHLYDHTWKWAKKVTRL
jgi:thymidylate synthase